MTSILDTTTEIAPDTVLTGVNPNIAVPVLHKFPSYLRSGVYPKALKLSNFRYAFVINQGQMNDWIKKDDLVRVQAKQIDTLRMSVTNMRYLILNQDLILGMQANMSNKVDDVFSNTHKTLMHTSKIVNFTDKELVQVENRLNNANDTITGLLKENKKLKRSNLIKTISGAVLSAALATKSIGLW